MSAKTGKQLPESETKADIPSSEQAIASLDLEGETHRWNSRKGFGLARQLVHAGQFVRDLRVQMRFGDLTRAPLDLLRLEICGRVVACDWIARLPDPWDISLSRPLQQRHVSLQTLRDAIDVRDLLFHTLPNVKTAHFRVYRQSPHQGHELILAGSSERGDNLLRRVRSLSMQAKLLGFRFSLENGTLHRISGDEEPVTSTQETSAASPSGDPFRAT